MTMTKIDRYLQAATRDNTRIAYQSAIRHYEEEWGGLLPATANAVAHYLSDYADQLTSSSLKARLSALARWHQDQGFPDPTKTAVVRSVMKGIRELHPHKPKQAPPVSLETLQQLDRWFSTQIQAASPGSAEHLTLTRDRALVYLGFWRAFRSDDLSRIRVEDITLQTGAMDIYLHRSKGDRQNAGASFRVPALNVLCPVDACRSWLSLAGFSDGPLFRKITQWGRIGDAPLHPNSLSRLIKGVFQAAGIDGFQQFSSHSLKRGFATWASETGWDVKTLMEYVGWKDAQTALGYTQAKDPFGGQRPPVTHIESKAPAPLATPSGFLLTIHLVVRPLRRHGKQHRKATEIILDQVLRPLGLLVRTDDDKVFELRSTITDASRLDSVIEDTIDEMHHITENRGCWIEVFISSRELGKTWD